VTSAVKPLPRTALTLLVFCGLSAAFSWPLLRDPLHTHVARQFDVYTLAWLSGAVGSLDAGLATSVSSWPLGESLGRADSFVLLLLARLLAPLQQPWLAGASCALLGPVLSAWAAERFAARHMGARFPWSLLAGAAYGFSGIAATALLEGHLYAMFNPWLPLLAGAWLRATGPDGRARDGLLAGLWWTLCLLTTAYAGIGATLMVLVLGVDALRGVRATPLVAAGAVAALSGGLWVWRFVHAGALERVDSALTGGAAAGVMAAGSARLGSLAGWTTSTDFSMHSIAPVLGFTSLSLAAVAPIVLRGERGWRPWLLLAGLCVALSLGPRLRLYDQGLSVPWLLAPLPALGGGASFFHFPVRLLWVAGLALGAVAARVATVLAERRGRLAWPLLAAAVVDVLVGTGAPLRTADVPVAAPSAYDAAPEGRAVLDLMPAFHGQSADLEWTWNNLSCAYQLSHHRPVTSTCLGTTRYGGPRVVIGGWLMSALLTAPPEGEPRDAGALAATLGELGIGAVALHADLFTRTDRDALIAGLREALGPPAADSRDGGEHLLLFTVPELAGRPEQFRARYLALSSEAP